MKNKLRAVLSIFCIISPVFVFATMLFFPELSRAYILYAFVVAFVAFLILLVNRDRIFSKKKRDNFFARGSALFGGRIDE